jgi:phosphoglycolate phosphatase
MKGGSGAEATSGELWPRGVLFDLDGTLADSFPTIHRALAAVLAQEGLPERSFEWVVAHVGRGATALVRDAVAPCTDEALVQRVVHRYAQAYEAIPLSETLPREGARGAVAFAAAGTGGRVAVVSNRTTAQAMDWLEYWGFAEVLAVVSGPDRSGATKPAAAAVQPVLEALGVTAVEALLVGDSAIDAHTAAGVGMAALLVGVRELEDVPGCRVELIKSLREFPAWLVHNGKGWRYD